MFKVIVEIQARTSRAALRAVVVAAYPGCAPTLAPASDAYPVEAPGRAAVAVCAGVRITVSAGAWHGYPPNLPRMMTPMLVVVENDSLRPIEIRYENFSLLGARAFAALPPFWPMGAVEPVTSVYPQSGFAVASWLAGSLPGRSVVTGEFPFHAGYYNRYFTEIVRTYRPSVDMQRKALPEGVLAPGGRVTGFIYFERVQIVGRIVFVSRLVAVGGGRALGTVEVPFVRRVAFVGPTTPRTSGHQDHDERRAARPVHAIVFAITRAVE